jgi:hypothetical protein
MSSAGTPTMAVSMAAFAFAIILSLSGERQNIEYQHASTQPRTHERPTPSILKICHGGQQHKNTLSLSGSCFEHASGAFGMSPSIMPSMWLLANMFG